MCSMSSLVTLFNTLVTVFDFATLVRLADNPYRCQSTIGEELGNLFVFYTDHQSAIWELVQQQADLTGLDTTEYLGEHILGEGHAQQSLALWAIHQAACELVDPDTVRLIRGAFGGEIPPGIKLVPLAA